MAKRIRLAGGLVGKAGLFAFIENNVDAVNGAVFCASPSGGFLD